MIDDKCKVCGDYIELARLELDMDTCKSCAFSFDVPKVKGNMVYGHKTGAFIDIMSEQSYNSNKKYFKPNGARSAVKNFSKSICV